MRKKLLQARASALNEVSKRKGGSAFVLAAVVENQQPVYDPKQALASFSCSDCHTGFSTNAEVASPFCPNCSSESVKASTVKAQALPKTDAELAFSICPHCETANVLHDATAKLFDGHLNCVTCGTLVSYETSDVGEGSEPVTMGDAEPGDIKSLVEDTKQPQTNPAALSSKKETADDKPTNLPDQVADGEKDQPISDADAYDILTEIEGDKLKPIPSVQAADFDQQDDQLQDPVVEDLTDEDLTDLQDATAITAGDNDQQEEETAGEPFGGKKAPPFGKKDGMKEGEDGDGDGKKDESCKSAVQVTLLSTLAAFSGDKTLTILSAGENVLAFVNDLHIATLTAEKAGTNAEIMHRPKFATAIAHTVKETGLQAALASYGFELTKVNFPQKAVIATLVAKQTKAETARIAKEQAQYTETFMQCMSIAAAGLNKGFFAKQENALKRGFYDNLTAAGVKGAEKLIDQVFSKFGNEHSKTVLTIAQELMGKPVEVRNAMSESVGNAAYMPVTAEEGDDDEDGQEEDATSLTARLENSSIIPLRRKETSSTPGSSIRGLRANAGGSLFKRS